MANAVGTDGSTYSERMTQAAHETVDRVGEHAADMERRLKDKADDIKRKSYETRDKARSMSEDVAENARSYTREHPIATLAMAFGAGVLLSRLMRR